MDRADDAEQSLLPCTYCAHAHELARAQVDISTAPRVMRAATRCRPAARPPAARSTRTTVARVPVASLSSLAPSYVLTRSTAPLLPRVTLHDVRGYHATPFTLKKGGKDKDDKKNKDNKQRGGADQLELDVDDLKQKMDRAIDSMKQDLANIRTGRANPAILDKVQVTIEGGSHSILQLGQISVRDANTLLITPYAEEHAKLIREAIQNSNLGLTPQQDQHYITIPIPKATQEYRDQLKAQVGKAAEQAKQRIRNSRKNALDELKQIEKQMSKDKFKSTEKEVQTLTDKYIATIDSLSKAKEKDIANF